MTAPDYVAIYKAAWRSMGHTCCELDSYEEEAIRAVARAAMERAAEIVARYPDDERTRILAEAIRREMEAI